jgi:hypothetical protein
VIECGYDSPHGARLKRDGEARLRQLSDATYEDAIGCLPSVANMWQQNVIDFAKASENRTAQKAKRAENAWSKRSIRCLSRR